MRKLEARLLTLRLRDRLLCRDLNVSFNAGQTWAILGPNGSGKTTLLHTLAGLRRPDAGGIWLNDVALSRVPARERAQHIGILFQDPDPTLPQTVFETVLSARHPFVSRYGFESKKDRAIVRKTLQEVGLVKFAPRTLSTLSGGERRRVEIAALLAQTTPVRLLDEPLNHLDLHYQQAMLRRLVAKQRDRQITIFVLHDANAAIQACDHALLLYGDGTHHHGPVSQVVTRKNLEQLYRTPLTELKRVGKRYFVTS